MWHTRKWWSQVLNSSLSDFKPCDLKYDTLLLAVLIGQHIREQTRLLCPCSQSEHWHPWAIRLPPFLSWLYYFWLNTMATWNNPGPSGPHSWHACQTTVSHLRWLHHYPGLEERSQNGPLFTLMCKPFQSVSLSTWVLLLLSSSFIPFWPCYNFPFLFWSLVSFWA
jgi:hypothetical protein